MKKIALLAVALMAGSAANADYRFFTTGNQLYSWCVDEPAIAMDYIVGVADGIALARDASTRLGSPLPIAELCLPNGVTRRQLKDTVCLWIERNPQERHDTGANLVALSILQTWPC